MPRGLLAQGPEVYLPKGVHVRSAWPARVFLTPPFLPEIKYPWVVNVLQLSCAKHRVALAVTFLRTVLPTS